MSPKMPVSSYLAVSPLPNFALCGKFGGLLSVALFPKITLGVR